MKITFDYNNVSPNEIAKTIEHFYNTYSDLILKNNGEEIGKLDFGKINLLRHSSTVRYRHRW